LVAAKNRPENICEFSRLRGREMKFPARPNRELIRAIRDFNSRQQGINSPQQGINPDWESEQKNRTRTVRSPRGSSQATPNRLERRRPHRHWPAARAASVETLKASKRANMKELRFDAADEVWRAAFAFDPLRQAVVLVARDNSGQSQARFYRALVAKPAERFDEHLPHQKRKVRYGANIERLDRGASTALDRGVTVGTGRFTKSLN
jgi:hypothetical protein